MDFVKIQNESVQRLETEKNPKLHRLSLIELKEMLERQEKLLANRWRENLLTTNDQLIHYTLFFLDCICSKLVNSLPDKGAKIKEQLMKIENAYKMKQVFEQTESMLSSLSLAAKIDLKQPLVWNFVRLLSL